jgi:predicted RND superfamily exporter protein
LWYDTNYQLFKAAYSSAAIALATAALVILASSRSFVLTLFSTATIGYVLVAVTATVVGMGWTLGFVESICFAILIGISCDYVIHFSHAYASLPGDVPREDRTKHALVDMGPSVLGGAFTTAGGSVAMLFTALIFFQKFATILLLTVLHGAIGSFVVFLAMTDAFGPSAPTATTDKIQSLTCLSGTKQTIAGAQKSGEDRTCHDECWDVN